MEVPFATELFVTELIFLHVHTDTLYALANIGTERSPIESRVNKRVQGRSARMCLGKKAKSMKDSTKRFFRTAG